MTTKTKTKAKAATGRSAATAASCGCGAPDGRGERRALGVDQELKSVNLTRLRRIEGQVRGIQKMVEEERYCAEIMTQISAVQEALRSVSQELMRNHLRHCAATAIRSGGSDAEAMYDELLDLMRRYSR